MSPFGADSSIDTAILLASFGGLGCMLVFVGVHLIARRDLSLADRLSGWGSAPPSRAVAAAERASVTGRLETVVARQSFAGAIQRDLARANIRLTVTEYLLIHAAAVAIGVVVGLATGNTLLGLALAILGFYAPRVVVSTAQRRRLKAFGDQLADTLLLMSNSLRAGYSLLQSMETVARDASQPSAEEFGRVVREVGLGLSPEEALLNLHRRMPSEDLDLMVTAINVQHEVGGNLAKIFDTLAETIRERNRIAGEIQTLTAQQRLGGYVISALPLVLAGGIFLLDANYLKPLMSSERVICMPAFGLPILALVMMVAGYIAIQRIVSIEV